MEDINKVLDVEGEVEGAADPVPLGEDKASSEDVTTEKKANILSHQADDYPMRATSIPFFGTEINLNAFTSLFGFTILWALSIWCMAAPNKASNTLADWTFGVTEKFTWFYIAANPAFTFFVLWLVIRYGHVKLGKQDEKPEFDDITYFMMLFSAGVGVGLFFFGVAEPLAHRSSNRFAEAGYHAQDEIDQFALLLTMYHWGFAAWSPYIIVAAAAGIASYRFDMPMTVRSTLYTLLGAHTWGWIGDILDGFSIVMTVGGICTSLGLGSMQIVTGSERLGWIDSGLDEDERTNKQVTVIWVITIVATISVVSGLSVGIKFLSQVGFGLGILCLFLCLVMEKTNYLFNLITQTVGVYFQYCIFEIPFWTDAFGQLEEGEGRAIDGNSAASTWMNGWTVFYMAWWTSWGAFVGLFLARISRGRTIRQLAMYSFIAPLIYSFIWFGVFGGIGLRQAREAEELEALGTEVFGNNETFLQPGSQFCYDVPQEDVLDPNTGEVVFTNKLIGITPVCQYDSTDTPQAWFNVMFSFSYPSDDGFGGFGSFMAGLSLIALTIYFVTSSDSGSLIVDHLASNGHEEHHWLQRVFWAFTEGAVASALLVAGGSTALSALQSASIILGLPFNFFLFAMMYSTVKMCVVADEQGKSGDHHGKLPAPEDTSFKMHLFGGIMNILEYIVSLGRVHEERIAVGIDKPSMFQVREFFVGLLCPFHSLFRILGVLGYSLYSKVALTLINFSFHVMWIVLCGLSVENFGYVAFGMACFFMNAIILTVIRMDVRKRYEIEGNVLGDFTAGSFFYPQALCQMLFEFENNSAPIEMMEEVEEVVEVAPMADEVEA